MNFKEFFQGLSAADRDRFAAAAGTSRRYIEVHLVFRRKVPKPRLVRALASACREFGADIGERELLAFFYYTASSEPAAA